MMLSFYAVSWIACIGKSTSIHRIRPRLCASYPAFLISAGVVATIGAQVLMWTLHKKHSLLEDHYVLTKEWSANGEPLRSDQGESSG